MRLILASLCFFLAFSFQVKAQEFITYTVKKDDTATSVAKEFNTSVSELYRFNPDSQNGLRVGSVLVLPKLSKNDAGEIEATQARTPRSFKTHRVKRKETLYSLAKEYGVTIEEIKRYNKRLYSEQLRRRDRIRIPVFPKVIISDEQTVENPNVIINEAPVAQVTEKDKAQKTHVVKPKEGKYGISRTYGMTIAELEAMNPDMEEPLQPGQILKVKGEASNESTVITDERFMYYEVKPKENFFRLEQRFKISEDSLIALNPSLEEGLKAGMVIKIPKSANTDFIFSERNFTNLEDRISRFNERTIALMLPFNTHRVGMDSISSPEDRIKRDRVMRISLDFYSGVMVALEEAKSKGLNTTVKVYDTQQSKSEVGRIIRDNDFSDVDAVIGPLLNSGVDEAASLLERRNIPVISPLSSKRANGNSNLVQSRPTEDMLEEIMLTYLDSMHTAQNVVIVADSKSTDIKRKLKDKFPFASVLDPREDNFLYQTDVSEEIIDDKENWFIVATEDVALLSNLTSYLNALCVDNNIQLFALEKNSAYDSQDVSNYHLSKLRFTFPSVDKEFDPDFPDDFITSYKAKYGIVPNKFAVRGYDITYDTLLRLATSEDLFDSLDQDFVTQYVENKFHFRRDGRSGYYNNGVYIMQYGENLTLKAVE